MTPEKIKETLRSDPIPWDELRERRVLGDIQQQLANDNSLQRVPLPQTPLKNMMQNKIALAAAATVLLCLGVFIGARLVAPQPSSNPSVDSHTTMHNGHQDGTDSTLEIKGLGRAVLASSAKMILEKETDDEIHLGQPTGHIHYVISPQRKKTLVIHAKQVEVRVIGTVFDVDVQKNAVSVSVQEGLVSIIAGDRKLFLGANERFETQLDALNKKATAKPNVPTEVSDVSERTSRESKNDKNTSNFKMATREKSPQPDTIADTRIPAGISVPRKAEETTGGDSVRIDDILKEVDSARKQGDYAKAKELLNQAIHTYPTHPRVPICYFTLGNVAVSSGQHSAAARAYRKYLLLAPGGILAEDASAAIADSLTRAGDQEGAAAAAQEYLNKYATGVHAQRMKALVK